jgi:photosystem II stability/assembly factor-like uncharacterized protein
MNFRAAFLPLSFFALLLFASPNDGFGQRRVDRNVPPRTPAQGSTSKNQETKLKPGQEKIRIEENVYRIVNSPWKLQDVKSDASLRGLHVFNAINIWATGSKGTVINSYNGGKSWRVLRIKGAEELDIRDVHVIDEASVVVMTSGTPARIYRSTNAGLSWKMVYENKDKRVFLDAISFLDDQTGVAMGDPIDKKLFLLRTADGGVTWSQVQKAPPTERGEGGFAASGTNMTVIGKRKVMIGLSSGLANQPDGRSRILVSDDYMRTWKQAAVPLPRNPSSGIFSLGFANSDDGVAIGGDYKNPNSTEGNYAVTRNGGGTWSVPKKRKPPSGYRSCVDAWVSGKELNYVAVGTNGTDVSRDLGNSWLRVSNVGFNSVQFTDDGKVGWAVGSDGRIAKWIGTR